MRYAVLIAAALLSFATPTQAQVKPGTTCPPITVCEATTRGPLCHTMMCDNSPPPTPMCIDGDMHFVPCSDVWDRPDTMCNMTVQWKLHNARTVKVMQLTPVCADEALEASSETTTRIIKLQK